MTFGCGLVRNDSLQTRSVSFYARFGGMMGDGWRESRMKCLFWRLGHLTFGAMPLFRCGSATTFTL